MCKKYGATFRETFPGRNVPLKTHVVKSELPKFARRWFGCRIFCEDAAESIHALMNRLARRYASVRDKKKRHEFQMSALNLLQDKEVVAETEAHRIRRRVRRSKKK